jgi:cobalamin transport system permease protein
LETLTLTPTAKACSLCGRGFACGQGRPGCWCESVNVSAQALAGIRAAASDCICPACLSGFADRDAGGGTQVWAKAVPDADVRARALAPWWAALAVAFPIASLALGLAIGPARIGPAAILASLLSHLPGIHLSSPLSRLDESILWQVRAPRVALAALAGAALAAAGAAYQGVFRNPLADPYLLGVAAGAGLGATLAIAYSGSLPYSPLLLPLAAFLGASLAVAAAYLLGRSAGGERDTTTLILAGIVIALFLTAVQTFLQQQRSQTLREVYSWILGGFTASDWTAVALIAPYVVASSLVIVLHRRVLDVLRLGDDEASSLGIDVGRARLSLVVAATIATAAAVAVSGLIGFVGIIVPHTIRLLVSPSYRVIVPLSLLAGAGFLVLADALARTILSPAELPIGVVTAFFGAPFFALLLRSTSKARL